MGTLSVKQLKEHSVLTYLHETWSVKWSDCHKLSRLRISVSLLTLEEDEISKEHFVFERRQNRHKQEIFTWRAAIPRSFLQTLQFARNKGLKIWLQEFKIKCKYVYICTYRWIFILVCFVYVSVWCNPAGLFWIVLLPPCADLHSGAQGNLHNRFGISFSVQRWPSPRICQHSALVFPDHISLPSSYSSSSLCLLILPYLPKSPFAPYQEKTPNRSNLLHLVVLFCCSLCVSLFLSWERNLCKWEKKDSQCLIKIQQWPVE